MMPVENFHRPVVHRPDIHRPDIVALHGFTGGAASWDRVRETLSSEIRLWALDLPGHAGWSGDLPHSFDVAVEQLADRIRSRTSEPVHLLAYSLGARLALGLLLENPELFQSATLIGVRPGLSVDERAERVLRDDQLADELEQGGLAAFVERWEALPLFASQSSVDAEVLDEQRRLRLGHDPAGLAWALRVLSPGRMPDYRPRLGEIRVPLRWMVGERDARFLEIANDACVRHPFDFEVVAGAGHNLPLEAPAAVARAVESSLEGADSEPTDTQFHKQPA